MNSYTTIDLSQYSSNQQPIKIDSCGVYYFKNSFEKAVNVDIAEGCAAQIVDFSSGGEFIINIEQNSSLKVLIAKISSSKSTFVVNIEGKGVDLDMQGVTLSSKEENIEIYTTINHNIGGSTSNQLFKCIANDNSKSTFEGRIYIAKDAQQTYAYQQNKNLLLSSGANIFSRPMLEIYADDVKCNHGSTTGMLSEEEIFYMRQRGISLSVAKQLQLEGFALEIIEKISIPELQEEVKTKILELIHND